MKISSKYWNDYGFALFIVAALVLYGFSVFGKYLSEKGMVGMESNAGMGDSYKQQSGSGGVLPSEPLGQNDVFASASGLQTSTPGLAGGSCSKPNIQNTADLLPKDTNSQWAQINPAGQGDLAHVNLLKSGYHVGIDTVGQSLRNPNLQERSEPPNPKINTGPWNGSTIEPDLMRPPLNIGSGPQ